MSHKCQIEESSTYCFEHKNELWVKGYADGHQKEGRTYRVKFCPECGFHLPKSSFGKSFFGRLNIPDVTPDNSILQFSQALSNAIAQMNHNVELIKCFMSSQNTQNECFMERELQHSQDICKLERQILNLEKTILDRGKP